MYYQIHIKDFKRYQYDNSNNILKSNYNNQIDLKQCKYIRYSNFTEGNDLNDTGDIS